MARQQKTRARKRKVFGKLPYTGADALRQNDRLVARVYEARRRMGLPPDSNVYVPLRDETTV